MGHRHAISDAAWSRVEGMLPGRPRSVGWAAADSRLLLDAVRYVAKTGVPWRDLPTRFGRWSTAYQRFDRWSRKGTWRVVFDALQNPDLEWLILDSTVTRAHPCAAGAPKKVGARTPRRWAGVGVGSARTSTSP